jgi:hypothetical protein
MGMSALHRAVSGASNDVPRIVAFAWEAISLKLRSAPPGAWTDLEDLAADTGFFLDCSPALAAELLEAAISTGALEGHLDPEERQQVRRPATRDRGLAHREERRS